MDTPQQIDVTTDLLRDWPLPQPPVDGDKEQRGHVLVVGGSREMPGAVILAAMAAMRAGAGKLSVATSESVAQLVAQALPEARVIALRENVAGDIRGDAAVQLPTEADALLIGPGMQDESAAVQFSIDAATRLPRSRIVLDALAMSMVLQNADVVHQSSREIVVTPHAGEMAHLTERTKETILADAPSAAIKYAKRWNVVVALKSATTLIAHPGGGVWRHDGGSKGLATSGSGDVLAGIIAGLAARGAPVDQATVWGVALHARAGAALQSRIGPLGYLAREIAAEIPGLMHELSCESVSITDPAPSN